MVFNIRVRNVLDIDYFRRRTTSHAHDNLVIFLKYIYTIRELNVCFEFNKTVNESKNSQPILY